MTWPQPLSKRCWSPSLMDLPPAPSQLLPPVESPEWAEVALSVYELNGARALNAVAEAVGLGGAYHVGIEVYWLEWSFGWNVKGTGVHVVPVAQSKIGTFKERISLGKTPLPPHLVFNVLAGMRSEWIGQEYHYLRRNCGHFCAELARRLCVPGEIPEWVTSLAETGDWVSQLFMPKLSEEECPGEIQPLTLQADRRPGTVSDKGREEQAVAKSELEWQWAQEYTFERARKVAQHDFEVRMLQGMVLDSPLLNRWVPHAPKWCPGSYAMMTGL